MTDNVMKPIEKKNPTFKRNLRALAGRLAPPVMGVGLLCSQCRESQGQPATTSSSAMSILKQAPRVRFEEPASGGAAGDDRGARIGVLPASAGSTPQGPRGMPVTGPAAARAQTESMIFGPGASGASSGAALGLPGAGRSTAGPGTSLFGAAPPAGMAPGIATSRAPITTGDSTTPPGYPSLNATPVATRAPLVLTPTPVPTKKPGILRGVVRHIPFVGSKLAGDARTPVPVAAAESGGGAEPSMAELPTAASDTSREPLAPRLNAPPPEPGLMATRAPGMPTDRAAAAAMAARAPGRVAAGSAPGSAAAASAQPSPDTSHRGQTVWSDPSHPASPAGVSTAAGTAGATSVGAGPRGPGALPSGTLPARPASTPFIISPKGPRSAEGVPVGGDSGLGTPRPLYVPVNPSGVGQSAGDRSQLMPSENSGTMFGGASTPAASPVAAPTEAAGDRSQYVSVTTTPAARSADLPASPPSASELSPSASDGASRTSPTLEANDLAMPNPSAEPNPSVRDNYITALQAAKAGNYGEAARQFRDYGTNHSGSKLAQRALFLAWQLEPSRQQAAADAKALESRFPDGKYLPELRRRRDREEAALQPATAPAPMTGEPAPTAAGAPVRSVAASFPEDTSGVEGGVAADDLEMLEAAVGRATDAASEDGGSAETAARLRLARAQLRQELFDKCLATLRPALDASAGSPIEGEILILISDASIAKRDFVQAARALDELVRRHPEAQRRPKVRLNLGLVQEDAGQYPQARAQYNALVEESPQSPEADLARERLADLRAL